jgi:uncharacterized membrane protein YhaH (DUF805 family)
MGSNLASLLIILLLFLTPAVAIWRENSGIRISRARFAMWTGILALFIITGSIFGDMVEDGATADSALTAFAPLFIILFAQFFYARQLVRRARDADVSKSYCYFFLIPVASFILIVVLLAKRTAPANVEATDGDVA